uniref:Uncharacterized protein n=1 Tax=Cucumis melo TaxID=3656 RepID=A0A9I9EAU1_CUCME
MVSNIGRAFTTRWKSIGHLFHRFGRAFATRWKSIAIFFIVLGCTLVLHLTSWLPDLYIEKMCEFQSFCWKSISWGILIPISRTSIRHSLEEHWPSFPSFRCFLTSNEHSPLVGRALAISLIVSGCILVLPPTNLLPDLYFGKICKRRCLGRRLKFIVYEFRNTCDQYKPKKSLKDRFLPRDRKIEFGAFSIEVLELSLFPSLEVHSQWFLTPDELLLLAGRALAICSIVTNRYQSIIRLVTQWPIGATEEQQKVGEMPVLSPIELLENIVSSDLGPDGQSTRPSSSGEEIKRGGRNARPLSKNDNWTLAFRRGNRREEQWLENQNHNQDWSSSSEDVESYATMNNRGHRFAPYRERRVEAYEYKMKIDLPIYDSTTEQKKVYLVALKLKGGASAWWDQVAINQQKQGRQPIQSWKKMKN